MTPLEKAARAAAEADGHDPDSFGLRVSSKRDSPGPYERVWQLYLPAVRAVLEAIRVPEWRDWKGALPGRDVDMRGHPAKYAAAAFTAMIDHIKEG